MLKNYQQTIKKPVSFSGFGLHTGKKTDITLYPAGGDKGIFFKRLDLEKNNLIYANYKNVSSATLCTTLENEFGAKVSTVEHLLAALYISEIDNVKIEINNEEVPILDGSASEFINLLKNVEKTVLSEKRKYLKIEKKVELIDGDRKIAVEPSGDYFQVDFQLKYKNKIIGNQKNSVNFEYDDLEDVYKSRTFCLFEEVEKIKKLGLAKGGSLENAVVVDREKILNKDGLRNKREFVNHKILDLSGDFLLSGFRVLGKVTCHQGGHELTNRFLKKLFSNKSSYSSIEIKENNLSQKVSSNQQDKIAVNA